MPFLKDIFEEIFDLLLNDFNEEQRKLLFGEAKRFTNWLKEQKVEDNVRIREFNYFNYYIL